MLLTVFLDILRLLQVKVLFFSTQNSQALIAFSDFDWVGCVETCRSIISFCVFLGPFLISWKFEKQATVLRSSSEVEYHAMASISRELQWLTSLLMDLQVARTKPIPLYWDNKSTLYITENLVFHEGTKYIEIDYHLVREKFQVGDSTNIFFLAR